MDLTRTEAIRQEFEVKSEMDNCDFFLNEPAIRMSKTVEQRIRNLKNSLIVKWLYLLDVIFRPKNKIG